MIVPNHAKHHPSTKTVIHISIYPYIMTKQKITISLDADIAKRLRTDSIAKYGNARSMSRLIEDLATGASIEEEPQPAACSLQDHRSEEYLKEEADFNKAVEEYTDQIQALKVYLTIDGEEYPLSTFVVDEYYTLKEAFETRLNNLADNINSCYNCRGLKAEVPKYPDAGKNFEIYSHNRFEEEN
jgi:hypothetical protein